MAGLAALLGGGGGGGGGFGGMGGGVPPVADPETAYASQLTQLQVGTSTTFPGVMHSAAYSHVALKETVGKWHCQDAQYILSRAASVQTGHFAYRVHRGLCLT